MFSSKKLSDSFHKSKESLEDYAQSITQVSHDIRFLELLLKNYGLNSPFKTLFGTEIGMVLTSRDEESDKVDIEHHYYEYVSWEINEKEKKPSFRIFYKKYERQVKPQSEGASQSNAVNFNRSAPSDAKLVENRPLVETPVLTRLKIYPYLPLFLEKLAEELSKFKTQLNFTKFKSSISEFEKTIRKKKS